MKIVLEHIRDKDNGIFWKLTQDIEVELLTTGETITIKAGMITDLSSVPKFLWGLFPPYGNFLPAAIVHDWMYIEDYKRKELGDKVARWNADREMLLQSMKYNPKKRIDNFIRYIFVRLFGGTIYKKWKYDSIIKRMKIS